MKHSEKIALLAFFDGIGTYKELEHWLISKCNTKCVIVPVWNELNRIKNYAQFIVKQSIYS